MSGNDEKIAQLVSIAGVNPTQAQKALQVW